MQPPPRPAIGGRKRDYHVYHHPHHRQALQADRHLHRLDGIPPRAAYDAAAAELREIITRAEGRATVRRLDVDNIMDALDSVPRCVLKKHLPGCEVHCDPNARSFPNAYHYRPDSTHFSAVCRPSGWYLTRVCRDTCGTSRGRLVLTDGAKADIIAAAETL